MKLLLVEGIDGAGKSSFIQKLSFALGNSVVFPFPSNLPQEKDIMDPASEVMFYLNDFNQELKFLNYEKPENVICDRSFLTTMAYQGYGEGLTRNSYFDSIFTLGSSIFTSKLKPGDTLHYIRIKCKIEECLRRLGKRNRTQEDRVDEIDKLSHIEKRSKLRSLDSKFEDIFNYVRSQGDAHLLHEVSTTQNSAEEACRKFLKELG